MVCTMLLSLVHEIVHLIVYCCGTCHTLVYYANTVLGQQKKLNALIPESFQLLLVCFLFGDNSLSHPDLETPLENTQRTKLGNDASID